MSVSPAASSGRSFASIAEAIEQLHHHNGLVRQEARRYLEQQGEAATASLIPLLNDSSHRVRWEATKAMVSIADPKTVVPLIEKLEDHRADVRWIAAEALIAIGQPAVTPLLHAIEDRPVAFGLREGAHHVLHDIALEHDLKWLDPVVTALASIEAREQVPQAVFAVLNQSED